MKRDKNTILVNIRSWFMVCSLAFLASTFNGCSKSAKTPKDTLVVAISSMPTTLDPRFATDAYSQWITSLTFQSLVRINKALEPEGEAASSIEMPDDKTYLFHLRPNLNFHTGQPVTVEDIIWSYNNYIDPAVASPFAAAFKKIKTINALGKDTIKITLDQPFAPFLIDLTLLKILPKTKGSLASSFFSKDQLGSGPFKLLATSQDFVELERVEKTQNKVAKVKFLLVQDPNTRFLKLKQGEIDLLQNALEYSLISEVKKDKNLVFDSGPGITFSYIIFNFHDPILKKIKVRQAIAHAINREAIITHLLSGAATQASSLLSPQNVFFKKGLPNYPFDLEKAKKLLDEAELKDPDGDGPIPRFKLEFKTVNQSESMEIAQVIMNQLRAVGIELNIRTFEWATYYQDLKEGNFQMAPGKLIGITDPAIYNDLFNSIYFTPAGRNRGFYSNPKLDQLLNLGNVTVNFEKRKEIYDQVQALVADDLPYLSLWYLNNLAAYRKGIEGYEMYPNGSYQFLININK